MHSVLLRATAKRVAIQSADSFEDDPVTTSVTLVLRQTLTNALPTIGLPHLIQKEITAFRSR